ncbi:biotin/lipoyl-containing protein [Telmatospirillum sp.]|uniref:biotin/lipoyl-containing protein n=1 Tax=Telmatospirillum sp. TaxID=2079197 RepID=UPI00284890CD|nr:biotin/lipoyl-containing protein [Telmatospirillum sp.]MDR3441359.1 acetyl-CoA carboxylase biotin carboxyl carrier protein subunit [Telmatospirillum sp.]
MSRKFKISVDGQSYNVVVDELTGDGVETPPPAATAHAVAAHAAVAAPPPVQSTVLAAAPGDEVAPLAGVVESIEVAVGTKIQVGDRIAVIEAMKMKTDVFAKHGGTVTRIAVKVHEGVETGQVLLSVG